MLRTEQNYSPIRTNYVHFGGATYPSTISLRSAVDSKNMNSHDMSAKKNFAANVVLHEAERRSVVVTADLITDEIGQDYHFYAKRNVQNDRNDVSVWENVAGKIFQTT